MCRPVAQDDPDHGGDARPGEAVPQGLQVGHAGHEYVAGRQASRLRPRCRAEAAREAQEIQARRASRFKPTALDIDRCLPVLEWMAWLGYRNDGQKEANIITAWAYGVPLWRLAQRFGCSDDTVRRWLNGAVAAIAMKFRDEIVRMM